MRRHAAYLVAHDVVHIRPLLQQDVTQPHVVGERCDVKARAAVVVGAIDYVGCALTTLIEEVLNDVWWAGKGVDIE